ncbi:NADH:ubiquinone oxidoreductase subunit NDUFA12 [Oceanibacterium hippocampi]|uniref:NADH dehydrogenase n=1 Tax=Oceanibacterium hippocampi TaxID=745714 RepID=A0A1Y5SXK8_9PROT|nr:NADH:ubiquinone oxidoreductase subunit NDUFA12 [Oceanibacterium hippocampi]SLN48822.1 NADH dehydrogenase [Oceanibacterium hippocampi]
MATWGTRLFTWLNGEPVGEDSFGNRYYTEKGKGTGLGGAKRRWVVYKGRPEASKVPAEWHSWLHHTVDALPTERARQPKDWEKPHLPNLSGTDHAYRPPGSVLAERSRPAATGDYEAWRPE